MRHYNIPIFIPHLGCPFDCIYCDQKKIAAQVGVPAIGEVKETIDVHLSTIPADAEVEVAFFGGSFTAVDKGLQAQYLEAVQDYIKDGRVAGIRLSTRPDFINQDILDFLAFYGVKTIELGVQSMDDGVLQASARSYTSADVIKSSRLIRQRQFDLGVQLMIGLPGDNRQLDIETTRRVIDLHPRQVRIYPTLVISGTHLQTMLDRGDYRPLSLQEAIDTCKEMSLMFQAHHIRVIRMGLYPGEGLRSPGVVAAGPFHPSFGELVEQAIYKEQAAMAIYTYFEAYPHTDEINIHLNPRDISKMSGKGKGSLHDLKRHFNLRAVHLKTEPDWPRDKLGISAGKQSAAVVTLDRREYIHNRMATRGRGC